MGKRGTRKSAAEYKREQRAFKKRFASFMAANHSLHNQIVTSSNHVLKYDHPLDSSTEQESNESNISDHECIILDSNSSDSEMLYEQLKEEREQLELQLEKGREVNAKLQEEIRILKRLNSKEEKEILTGFRQIFTQKEFQDSVLSLLDKCVDLQRKIDSYR